jgi:hypothetical protein
VTKRLLFLLFLFGCRADVKESAVSNDSTKDNFRVIDKDTLATKKVWGDDIDSIATKLKAYSEQLYNIDTLPQPEQSIEYMGLNSLITAGARYLLNTDSTKKINVETLFKKSRIYALQSTDGNFRVLSWYINNGGSFQMYNNIKQVFTKTKNYVYYKEDLEEGLQPVALYHLQVKDSNAYLLLSKGVTCGNCFDNLAEAFIIDENIGLKDFNCFPDNKSTFLIETRMQEGLVFNFNPKKQELKVAYNIDDLTQNFTDSMGDRINLVYTFDGYNFKRKTAN